MLEGASMARIAVPRTTAAIRDPKCTGGLSPPQLLWTAVA